MATSRSPLTGSPSIDGENITFSLPYNDQRPEVPVGIPCNELEPGFLSSNPMGKPGMGNSLKNALFADR